MTLHETRLALGNFLKIAIDINSLEIHFECPFSTSDIVTLHLPLMASTHNIISKDIIDRMKPGSVLINAARGGLVDEGALDLALRRGHLQSAGLDVFEGEPPSDDNPLLANPACILTPHIAAGTRDALEQKLAAVFDSFDVEAILGYLSKVPRILVLVSKGSM